MSDSFREVAVEAAVSAGRLLRSHAGALRSITYKSGPTNIVTEMDRRAETLIVDAIRARFPAHSILGEERGLVAGTASHRWIVDPLDGTTNYAHGVPVYGVSIALEVAGRVALGVVYDPSREECFVAERGRGAVLNEAPIRVSGTSSLEESLLGTGYPYDVRETSSDNLAEHNWLMFHCRAVRELGSAVLTLAYVASGRLDAFWEGRLGPWDVAAGALLVEEAGGTVTSVTGGRLDLAVPSIIASNGLIHDEVLRALEEVRSR